ncbi:sure-like protein [Basidiobolus meristosporus CBS 931.73]|uniref:Sure-like protein n=1 Tax=Basidiobolus meristosporus CBS 931.73 TaxID=1314790 RepID=A0A1Y1YRH1_9FUNG|nr:sure-like protein [Basidiobolus meristosporus CBS 931.73]|eukprot:ORY00566.1 sure-like protein [Basidiobolus meristosporus CBS 931.73]
MLTTPKPRVFITNDDGPPSPESPFLLPFVKALEATLGWEYYGTRSKQTFFGSVCIPDSQKSWVSKAFYIQDSVRCTYYNQDTNEVEKVKASGENSSKTWCLLSGTPATCVNIGLHHIFAKEEFDLVISGPNFGRNSSRASALASGTIGAALDGCLASKKAIALSFAYFNRDTITEEKVANACSMALSVISHIWNRGWPKGVELFNINIPLVDEPERPIMVTKLHQNVYRSLFEPVKDAEGEVVYKFAPDLKWLHDPAKLPEDSDAFAINQRYISVTPMLATYKSVDDVTMDFSDLTSLTSS